MQSLRLILRKRRLEMDWINFEDMPEFVADCLASSFSIEGEEFYSTEDFYNRIRESA